jgi:MFS family permease
VLNRAPQRDALVTPAFVWPTLGHFLQALGYSSMILLPRYLDFLGASRAEIGAIMGAAALGGLSVRPLVGWSLDTVGRKPTLLVGTLLMSSAMGLVAFMADVGWFPYAVRILFGMGMGALFTGYFTMAADVVPDSRRTEGLALFGVSGLTPLLVNPLSERGGVAGADVAWFLPLMGALVFCSLLPLSQVPEKPVPATERPRLKLAEVWAALTARPLWSVWLADFVFAGLVGVFMAFVLVVAADRGMATPADVWITYAVGAISVRLFGATLPQRIGLSRMLGPVLFLYVAAMAVVAQAETPLGLYLAGLLGGLSHGYAFPILTAQTVSRAPDALRGSAMSVFTGVWDLTKVVLTPAVGLIADAAGDTVMLWTVAGAGLAGIGVWRLLEAGAGQVERA